MIMKYMDMDHILFIHQLIFQIIQYTIFLRLNDRMFQL